MKNPDHGAVSIEAQNDGTQFVSPRTHFGDSVPV
jgi:hypothetical protein